MIFWKVDAILSHLETELSDLFGFSCCTLYYNYFESKICIGLILLSHVIYKGKCDERIFLEVEMLQRLLFTFRV